MTGAPGAGKTTVLRALEIESVQKIEESAREVLSSSGGLQLRDEDPEGFVNACFESDIKKLMLAKRMNQPAIFDRAIGDTLGNYLLMGRPIPKKYRETANRMRYSGPVFDFPAWREIYEPDELRTQSFAEAVESRKAVIAAWRELKYDPVTVPLSSVKERASWLRAGLF